MENIIRYLVAVTLISSICFVNNAYADSNKTSQSVEISAAGSLEWDKKAQKYSVHKDVIVTQSDITIKCDILNAHYKDTKNLADITVLEADKNVIISSPPYTAFGDKATYDVVSGKAVLMGDTVSITTENDVMTTQDRIEFLRDKKKVIAFGRPIIKHQLDTITADVMAAYFKEDKKGKMVSDKMVADGNVKIETKDEVITGNRLVFNSQTRQAVMTGDVLVKKGDNHIKGVKAVVDMNTGISQLLGNSTSKDGSGRVKGVFFPKGKKKN